MILAHAILGLLPVESGQFSVFFFAGSVAPDIDHLWVLTKEKIPFSKIWDSLKYERKYSVSYKTKYLHSFFGALVLSVAATLFDRQGAAWFLAGYISHLVLDLFDIDEKQYFYPLNLKLKGFLPIFSVPERIFTALLIVSVLSIYLR